MKKRRRVMNKRRTNGSTHAYLLMRVTLYLLYYLIVPHAYQRRMNVMFLWILLKYLLWVKPMKVLIPLFFELDRNYVFIYHEKHALCDSYIVELIHEGTEN